MLYVEVQNVLTKTDALSDRLWLLCVCVCLCVFLHIQSEWVWVHYDRYQSKYSNISGPKLQNKSVCKVSPSAMFGPMRTSESDGTQSEWREWSVWIINKWWSSWEGPLTTHFRGTEEKHTQSLQTDNAHSLCLYWILISTCICCVFWVCVFSCW